LVGSVRHFVSHPGNGFVRRNHQSGQIIGRVVALRLVFEAVCDELRHRVPHDFRVRNNRHGNPFLRTETFSDGLKAATNAYIIGCFGILQKL
jgi:hypothetical protein